MQCISPYTLKTPRNGITHVPCGKCLFCLQTKRNDWSFRLWQELKESSSALFVTLTYSDESVPRNEANIPVLCKRDVQLFIKRLRKYQAKVTPNKIRYYCVGEYGTQTSRPHYHILLFNVHSRASAKMLGIWKAGHISFGNVNEASIHYTTKYMVDRGEGPVKPFTLMSLKPAIGHGYLNRMRAWHREDKRNYAMHNGYKLRLPRYYKDRIFNPAERSRMALENLARIDQATNKELDRLTLLHPDPFNYHQEKINQQYNRVKTKTKSKI